MTAATIFALTLAGMIGALFDLWTWGIMIVGALLMKSRRALLAWAAGCALLLSMVSMLALTGPASAIGMGVGAVFILLLRFFSACIAGFVSAAVIEWLRRPRNVAPGAEPQAPPSKED